MRFADSSTAAPVGHPTVVGKAMTSPSTPMPAMKPTDILFTPAQCGELHFKNRIVAAPMTR